VETRHNVLTICNTRDDALALTVKGRLIMIPDLRAPNAVYHASCYCNFCEIEVNSKPGRPVDATKQAAFDKLCSWLEVTDDELLTLKKLTKKTKELMGDDCEVYSEQTLQDKLLVK
jgi:hypothetical protein